MWASTYCRETEGCSLFLYLHSVITWSDMKIRLSTTIKRPILGRSSPLFQQTASVISFITSEPNLGTHFWRVPIINRPKKLLLFNSKKEFLKMTL